MTSETGCKGGENAVVSSEKIREHFRMTEEFVRSLKKELVYYRDQNERFLKERGELLQLLLRAQVPKDKLDELERENGFVKKERDRLADALVELGGEHERCKARCASLEDSLTCEQAGHAEARDVIIYLEAQIDQLEAMIALLQEHKDLCRDEGR